MFIYIETTPTGYTVYNDNTEIKHEIIRGLVILYSTVYLN